MYRTSAILDAARLVRTAHGTVAKATERADECKLRDLATELVDLECQLLKIHGQLIEAAMDASGPSVGKNRLDSQGRLV